MTAPDVGQGGPTAGGGDTEGAGKAGGADDGAPRVGEGDTTPGEGDPGKHRGEKDAGEAPKTPTGAQEPEAPAGDTRAREAVSNAGNGAYRQEHERASQHIMGDQVGGDKIVNLLLGEKRVRLTMLAQQFVEDMQYAFVEPTGWNDLRHRFEMHRIVILRGRPGTGRRATAIRLLQAASVAAVYELDPDVDLSAFAELLQSDAATRQRLLPQAAFLLHNPSQRVGGFGLRAMASELETMRGRLVVTTGPDDLVAEDDVRRYVVELDGTPSPIAVLHKHLAWHLGDRRAEETASRPEFQALVNDLLGDDTSLESAAMLAERIRWECEQEEEVDFDRIRRFITASDTDAFAQWFAGLPDLGTRSFAMALAVMDGLPLVDIARAADALQARLDTTERLVAASDLTLVPNAVDPMRTSNTRRLQLLRATAEPGHVRGSVGRVPTTVARYRDQKMARIVIERAWLDYQIQDEILHWIRGLIDDRSEPVRAFAGTSLGLLATLSFDRVYSEVLLPFAADSMGTRREAVAWALRAAATNAGLWPTVTRVIRQWYEHANPLLQATAARAYGVILGRSDLAGCLSDLGRLSGVDNSDVMVAIGAALADLVVHDPPMTAPVILPTLLGWLDHPKRSEAGQLAFLIVAISTSTEITVTDGARVTWPSLLYLTREDAKVRGPLVTLWHRVLNEGDLAEVAEKVLAEWAGRAEANDDVLDAFGRLVRAIGGQTFSTRRTLLRLADDWVEPERLTLMPRAARTIRVVLGEGGDHDGRR